MLYSGCGAILLATLTVADAHICLSAQHATAGDLLWQLGDKAPPNDGFTAARIYPTQAAIAAAEAAAAAAGSEGVEGGSGDAAGAAAGAAEAAEQLGGLHLAAAGSSTDAEGGAAGAEGSEAVGAAAGAAAAGGAVDMDSLLEAAVLAGLQALKNADLPIQGGDFYTKFMVPAKPEGEWAETCRGCCGKQVGWNGRSACTCRRVHASHPVSLFGSLAMGASMANGGATEHACRLECPSTAQARLIV